MIFLIVINIPKTQNVQQNLIKVNQKEKLQNEAHIKQFYLDEYLTTFKEAISISNENITTQSLSNYIRNEKQEQQENKKDRIIIENPLHHLLEIIFIPIQAKNLERKKKNHEKKDQILQQIFKILWWIISNKFLHLSIDSIKLILIKLYIIPIENQQKHYKQIFQLYTRIFELVFQRLSIACSIQNSENPISLYLDNDSKNEIKEQVNKVLLTTLDRVVLKKINQSNENMEINNTIPKIKKNIKNEIGQLSGFYGWCIICRKTANYYCINTKNSVCSLDCKIINQNDEKIYKSYFAQGESNLKQDQYFVQNYEQLIIWALNRIFKDRREDFLTVISSLVDSQSQTIKRNKQLLTLIQKYLFQKIIKNEENFNQGKIYYLISVAIKKYRNLMIKEIEVLITFQIIKPLQEMDKNYNQKHLILETLKNIFQFDEVIFEIFKNYDLQKNCINLMQEILDIIYDIFQNKIIIGDVNINQKMITDQRLITLQIFQIIIQKFYNLISIILQENQQQNINKENSLIKKLQFQDNNVFKILVQQDILDENDPQTLINLLKRHKISNKIIGNILTSEDQFFEDSFQQFLKPIKFESMNVLQALKYVQTKISFPDGNLKQQIYLKRFGQFYSKIIGQEEHMIQVQDLIQLLFIIDKINQCKDQDYIKIEQFEQLFNQIVGEKIFKNSDLIKYYYHIENNQIFNDETKINQISNVNLILKERIQKKMDYYKSSKILFDENYQFGFSLNDIKIFFETFIQQFCTVFEYILKNQEESKILDMIDIILNYIKISQLLDLPEIKNKLILLIYGQCQIDKIKFQTLNSKNLQLIKILLQLPKILNYKLGQNWQQIIQIEVQLKFYDEKFQLGKLENATLENNCQYLQEIFKQKENVKDFFNDIEIQEMFQYLKGLVQICIINYKQKDEKFQTSMDYLEKFILNNSENNVLIWKLFWGKIKNLYNDIFKEENHWKNQETLSLQNLKRIMFYFLENTNIFKYNLQVEILKIFDDVLSQTIYHSQEILKYLQYIIYSLFKRYNDQLGEGQVYLMTILLKITKIEKFNQEFDFEQYNQVFEIIEKIFENPHRYQNVLSDQNLTIIKVINSLSQKKNQILTQKYLNCLNLYYQLLWHQDKLETISKTILKQMKYMKENSNCSVLKNQSEFIQTVIFKNFTIISNFQLWNNQVVYQNVLSLLFEFLISYQEDFNQENWNQLFDQFITKIFDSIHTLYINIFSYEILYFFYDKIIQLSILGNEKASLAQQFFKLVNKLEKQNDPKHYDALVQILTITIGKISKQENNQKQAEYFFNYIKNSIKGNLPINLINNKLWNSIETSSNFIIDLKKLDKKLDFKYFDQVSHQSQLLKKFTEIFENTLQVIEFPENFIEEYFQIIDEVVNFCNQYHLQPLKRYIYQNKGFEIIVENLPNLIYVVKVLTQCQFEILIKFEKDQEKILNYIEKLFREYLRLKKNMIQCFKEYKNMEKIQLIYPSELNEDFMLKKFLESQQFLNWIKILLNKKVHPFLNKLKLEKIENFDYKSFSQILIKYYSEFDVFTLSSQKCQKCVNCFDCGEIINNFEEKISLEDFIDRIMILRFENNQFDIIIK